MRRTLSGLKHMVTVFSKRIFGVRFKSSLKVLLGCAAVLVIGLHFSVLTVHAVGDGDVAPTNFQQNKVDPAGAVAEKKAVEEQSKDQSCSLSGNGGIVAGLECHIANALAWLLNWVIWFLGKILLFLIDIFIGFARYDGFSTAKPVEIGWSLVRDIVNMFFIVILLISAFATIIRYESSYHYTKVLPKLLLMAVLINFSRTLIQLLIDFSQVIMLTFVEAFRQIGSGNFVVAFGLDKLTSMNDPTATGASAVASGAADAMNVVVASLLGIALLVIAIGVMIIMTAFIIGRIIGLWMALIFSPIALFATAVPSRLQKGLGEFTSKYWSRLSGFLTGGPIIAFFVWLALATVQATAQSAGGLSGGLQLYEGSGALAPFLTKIGQSNAIASFFIAIAMMMMGLDAAVDAAKNVGGVVSKFANKAKDKTLSLASQIPLRALRATTAPLRRGARVAGRGIGAGASFAANRGVIPLARRAGAALGGTRAGAFIAGAGGRVAAGARGAAGSRAGQAVLGGAADLGREVFGEVGGRELVQGVASRFGFKAARDKKVEELLKGTEKMTFGQQQAYLQTIGRAPSAPPEQRMAAAKLMQTMASEKGQKELVKTLSQREQQRLEATGVPAAEARTRAGRIASRQAQVQQQQILAQARAIQESLGNRDAVEAIDKEIKKNPSLAANQNGFNGAIRSALSDPAAMKELSKDAKSDPRVLRGLLGDGVTADAAGNITGIGNRATISQFLRDNKDDKDLTSSVQALVGHIENSPAGIPANDFNALTVQTDQNGRKQFYSTQTGDVVRNANVAAARTALVDTAGSSFMAGGALPAAEQANVRNYATAGGSMADLYQAAGDQTNPDRPRARETGIVIAGRFIDANALPATATATQRTQAVQPAMSILSQIEDRGIDATTQDRWIEGLEASGATTSPTSGRPSHYLVDRYSELGDHKDTVKKIIETAYRRRNEIRQEMARTGQVAAARPPREQAVLRFTERMDNIPPDELPRGLRILRDT